MSLYKQQQQSYFLVKKSELKSCPVINGGANVNWTDPALFQAMKTNPDDSCKQPAVTGERIQTGPPHLTKPGPKTCRQYWPCCIPHMLLLLPCPSTKCHWAMLPQSGDEDVLFCPDSSVHSVLHEVCLPIWADFCLLDMGFRIFLGVCKAPLLEL